MSILDFFLGLFRSEPEKEEPSVPPVRALPPAEPPAPKKLSPPPAPPLPPGEVDLVAVYTEGGIDARRLGLVKKAQALLGDLPPETPAPLKRRIVETSLRAFEVPTADIIAAASSQLELLAAFDEKTRTDTERRLADERARIADLEAKIAAARQTMEEAREEQASRERKTVAEREQVAAVLAFFDQKPTAQIFPLVEPTKSPDQKPIDQKPKAPAAPAAPAAPVAVVAVVAPVEDALDESDEVPAAPDSTSPVTSVGRRA